MRNLRVMTEKEVESENMEERFDKNFHLHPDFASLIRGIVNSYEKSRERSLALTKLEEVELWLMKAKRTEQQNV